MGGAWIFLVVVLVILVGLALTAYSRRGSGLTNEAADERDAAPEAGRTPSGPGRDRAGVDPFDERGTR
jgi:hypothetical protein